MWVSQIKNERDQGGWWGSVLSANISEVTSIVINSNQTGQQTKDNKNDPPSAKIKSTEVSAPIPSEAVAVKNLWNDTDLRASSSQPSITLSSIFPLSDNTVHLTTTTTTTQKLQTPTYQDVSTLTGFDSTEKAALQSANNVIRYGLDHLCDSFNNPDVDCKKLKIDQHSIMLALIAKGESLFRQALESYDKSSSVSSFPSNISLIEEKSEKEKKTSVSSNVSVSSKVPKPAIPFPQHLMTKLKKSLIERSVNLKNGRTPCSVNGKFSVAYLNLSCPFTTLVVQWKQ